MILAIKDYLARLKESDELDKLLPDLLLNMNIIPVTLPQKGTRQNGVDVSAVDNEAKILYLFVVKCGNIGRTEWNGQSNQSIRPTLDEIIDSYSRSNVLPEYEDYLKKIVICTGGEFKQEIEQQKAGYAHTNTIQGKREYEFWDGNRLAELIEKYMFNENIILGDYASEIRKTLALIGDSDYDLSDYHKFITENLDNKEGNVNIVIKRFTTINLSLELVKRWAEDADNLKPALYAAEDTMLTLWKFVQQNVFISNKYIMEHLGKIYLTGIKIYQDYVNKLSQLYTKRDGLHGYTRYPALESIKVFEQMGILAISGLMFIPGIKAEGDTNILKLCENRKNLLISMIQNHKSLLNPMFDNHSIDISLAIMLLSYFNEYKFIDTWLSNMVNSIAFAFNSGMYFPVISDSLDDIVSLSTGDISKEELMRTSVLLPTLLYWATWLNLPHAYDEIKDVMKSVFKNTSFQIWYPDDTTDTFLYSENAGYMSGINIQIEIPDTIEEMRGRLMKEHEEKLNRIHISAIENGYITLPLIASRHFRTPTLPIYFNLIYNHANEALHA
jgi:hypothetical protein